MKKMLKWIIVAVVVFVVVAIVGVVLSLDKIVKVAVEKGSEKSLQIPTTLGSASIGLLKGDVALNNLVVGSPEGFSAPHMLSLGNLSVDTSYKKLFGDPVSIDSILIDKPQLTLEFKGTKSNLKAVADKLSSGTGGDQTPAKTDPNAKPLKLIIDDLKMNGAQINVISDMLGGKSFTFDVPAIDMQNIGNADGNRNGEESGKVISQIISRLTIEAQKSGKMPPELATILNGDLGDLVGKLGTQFQAQAQQLQAQAMQQVDAIKNQATDKLNDAKSQLQDKTSDLQKQAKDKFGSFGGGLLGGDKSKDKKSDDAK